MYQPVWLIRCSTDKTARLNFQGHNFQDQFLITCELCEDTVVETAKEMQWNLDQCQGSDMLCREENNRKEMFPFTFTHKTIKQINIK